MQYRETDLAFIERLAAEEGWYYYFDHRADSHELRFGHQSIASPILGTLTYNAKPAGDRSFACLWRFDYCRKVTTTSQTLTRLHLFNPNYNLEHQHHHRHPGLLIVIRLKVRSILRQFMKNMTIRVDIRKMNRAIRSVFIV